MRALAQLYAPARVVEVAFENLALAADELMDEALLEFARGPDERWPCPKAFFCDPVTRTLVAALPTGVDARTGLPRLHFLALRVKAETNPDNFLTEVLVLRREVERLRRERLYAGGCALGAFEGATYVVVAARGYARGGVYVSRASREFALCYVVEDSVEALMRLARGLLRWLEARLSALCSSLGLDELVGGRPVASVVEWLRREAAGRLSDLGDGLRRTLRQLAALWRMVDRRLRALEVLRGLRGAAEAAAALADSAADALSALFPTVGKLVARSYFVVPSWFVKAVDAILSARPAT